MNNPYHATTKKGQPDLYATSAVCQSLNSFVVNYLDGKLPVWQHLDFARRLEQCPSCESYVNRYRDPGFENQSSASQFDCDAMPIPLIKAISSSRVVIN